MKQSFIIISLSSTKSGPEKDHDGVGSANLENCYSDGMYSKDKLKGLKWLRKSKEHWSRRAQNETLLFFLLLLHALSFFLEGRV